MTIDVEFKVSSSSHMEHDNEMFSHFAFLLQLVEKRLTVKHALATFVPERTLCCYVKCTKCITSSTN